MSEAAHKTEPGQEFWRPPISMAAGRTQPAEGAAEKCPQCGAEYPLGARYCHLCGAVRPGAGHDWRPAVRHLWRTLQVRRALGLSQASMIAFVAGGLCVLMALITGWAFSATSLSDWQAVQVWRIEWLLAAVVALLAAILLKKPEA